jgi:glycosyltransferase involved in cell wall biosynthesis
VSNFDDPRTEDDGRALRRALMVTYYFPPSGGPGVQRVLKFTRYLPAHGYRPLILTVPETAEFPVRDPSLLQEIPREAAVYRSPIREFYGFYRKAAGKKTAEQSVNLTTTAGTPLGLRERLLNKARASIFIPDGRAGWLAGGTREGLRICRSEDVRVIFASGPPFTAHWIARRISQRCGLPLVLDFRDPWTRAPFYPTRPGWARRLDERLEHSCLRQARAIITVNQAIRDDFLRRYPACDPQIMHVIPNGFDPADFTGRARHPAPVWTLTHTGTLPGHRFPAGLLPALANVLAAEPKLSDGLQVRLVGHVPPGLRALFLAPPLDRVFRLEGYRPHGESVQALLDSDLLLLLIENGPQAKGILTGKLFEYLGSGTPILALAPEGEAADLIRRTGAGRVAPGDDAQAVESALREALSAYREGRRAFGAADAEAIMEHSRVRLTERLARVFDSIVPPP